MNPLMWLEVPWRSSHRSLRWLSAVVFVVCCTAALLIGWLEGQHKGWMGAIAIYGFGLVYLWAFFLSTTLLLAIDMRQLRVPGVQWQIVRGLLSYGLLSIGVPAGMAAVVGLPAWNVAVLLGVVGAGGLLFALMPRFVAVIVGLMPSLLMAIWRRFSLPGMDDPRFAHWALFVLLLLLVAVILRWRQLLLAGPNTSLGWSTPMVIQFRNGNWGQWNNIGDSQQLRQLPDWLRPTPDLHDAGPANPRKALRVALGGWYMPQTMRSMLMQWTFAALCMTVPGVGSILLSRMGHSDGQMVMIATRGAILGALGSLSLIAAPMISLLTMVWITRRWQRVNAELPLLALLPGLGQPAAAKRSLVQAALRMPLALHGLLVMLVLLVMVFWQGHAQMLGFMLLAQLGAATVTAAFVMNLLGGRALKTLANSVTLILVFVLTLLSLILPSMALGQHPVAWAAPWLPALLLAWLLLAAAMLWLSRRGWRNLQVLPHAFLMH